MPAPFRDYAMGSAYDEMFRANGRPRTHYRNLYTQLMNLPSDAWPEEPWLEQVWRGPNAVLYRVLRNAG